MSDDLIEYIRRRNIALIAMDVQWFIDTMARNGHPNADPFTTLVAMHKTRYNVPGIPDVYRHESGKWLRQQGFTDLYGMQLLPEGDLPE